MIYFHGWASICHETLYLLLFFIFLDISVQATGHVNLIVYRNKNSTLILGGGGWGLLFIFRRVGFCRKRLGPGMIGFSQNSLAHLKKFLKKTYPLSTDKTP